MIEIYYGMENVKLWCYFVKGCDRFYGIVYFFNEDRIFKIIELRLFIVI